MPPFSFRLSSAFYAALFVLIFLAQSLYLAAANSGVSDETAHLMAGYSYWKSGAYEINLEHPPLVKRIAALPLLFMDLKSPVPDQQWHGQDQWKTGWDFLYTLGNPAEKMIFRSRLMLFPLLIFMAIFIFCWTQELFGGPAALGALFFFAFFPDLIAHSLLVTTDFSVSVFYYATFYFLYRFYLSHAKRDLILGAVMAGLGLVSKFSAVLALPLIFFLAVAMACEEHSPQDFFRFPAAVLLLMTLAVVTDRTPALIFGFPLLFFWAYRFQPTLPLVRIPRLRFAVGMILFVLAVTFLIVALVYFEPHFWFEKFRPFRRFLRGWQIFRGHAQDQVHPGFLLEQYSPHGWWYYYLAAMAVKIPLPLLVAAFLGGAKALQEAFRQKRKAMAIFFVPPLFFLFVASFLNHTHIGIRHIMPLYPFLLSLAGGGLAGLLQWKNRARGVATAAVLGIWLVAGSLFRFPHYLSYFNELAPLLGGKEKILGDSNITWGQDLKRLRDYVKQEKISKIKVLLVSTRYEIEYYHLPFEPSEEDFRLQKPAVYAVDISTYQRLLKSPGFEWLAKRRPDATVGGSIWIYKL